MQNGLQWQERLGCGLPCLVEEIRANGHPRGQALGAVHRGNICSGGSQAQQRCPHPSNCAVEALSTAGAAVLVGELCLRMCLFFVTFTVLEVIPIFLNASVPAACCCQPYRACLFFTGAPLLPLVLPAYFSVGQ